MPLVRALNKHGNIQSCQSTVRGTADASREEENRETVIKISIDLRRMAQLSSPQGSVSKHNERCTYIHLTEDHVHNAAYDDEEVKHVPGVSKVSLWRREERVSAL
jgi:hypothetical protein